MSKKGKRRKEREKIDEQSNGEKPKQARNKKTFMRMVAERDKALLSLDRLKILRYMKKWATPDEFKYLVEVDDKTFWARVHKARRHCTTLSEATRNESKQWLADRGWE